MNDEIKQKGDIEVSSTTEKRLVEGMTPEELSERSGLPCEYNDPIAVRRVENLGLSTGGPVVVWDGGWELRPGHMTRVFQTREADDALSSDAEYRVDIHGFDGSLTELFLVLSKFKRAVEGDVFNILSQLAEWTEKGTPYTYFSINLNGDEDIVGTVCAIVTQVR